MSPKKSKPKIFVKQPGTPMSAQGVLLFILPLAALVATLKAFASGNLLGICINGIGYALYLTAALLVRKGLKAEADYQRKKVAMAPKPYKTTAAILVAAATAVIAWLGARYPIAVSGLFGLGAFLGMYLNYGFDPKQEKKIAGSHGYTTEEILRTLDEAEQTIQQIETAGDGIEDTDIQQRIERICENARGVLTRLEDDPSDIRRTRKFLHVYLDGTRKVTEGYARTHQKAASETLDSNFRQALETLENEFLRQQQRLLNDDVFDLDVQIEVLTKQLKRDGVL